MKLRCPRCGLDEEGRGIMCPSSDAPPLTWKPVLWTTVGVLAIVLIFGLFLGGVA